MPLSPGDTLGPYRIVSAIGAGGMGEVYKAIDTRLDRTVAIKVLPAHIANREDLRARFEREARAVSALNHPHICALYDVGDGFMVMEHLEGETLAERIAKGALGLEQAILFATRIASALDRAHRTGVVHRDIKPSNVMLTRDGAKVLDFGLAKTVPKTIGSGDATLTAALTSEGTVLGTPHYMPPEQYEGKEADERSDIFAFGCVVYEMIAGKRPFDGTTRAAIIASVLGAEPAPLAPAHIQKIVARCLQKDPDERWQSIRDVQLELKSAPVETVAAPAPKRSWLWPAVAATGLAAAAVFGVLWLRKPVQELQPVQFSVEPPKGTHYPNAVAAAVVSPDGKTLAFIASTADVQRQIWIRPIGSLAARPLPNTEGSAEPFWSPDSQSLAFFADQKLKRTNIATGITTVICDSGSSFSGSWGANDVIVFASERGILSVAATGGTPALVTKDGVPGYYPQFLPDGEHFLYLQSSDDPNVEGTYAASIRERSAGTRILAARRKALYAPQLAGRHGYLLWIRDNTLLAQQFDAGRLTLEGEAVPVADEIATASQRLNYAAWVSPSGAISFRRATERPPVRMVWIGRDGKRESVGPEGPFTGVRLSQDKKRAALVREEGANSDIWIYDFARSFMTRLTFDSAAESTPVWSPDGREVAYVVASDKAVRVLKKEAGGGAEVTVLDSGGGTLDDWSPDGKHLLFSLRSSSFFSDIFVAPAQAGGKRSDWFVGPGSQAEAAISPDGKWIAYANSEGTRQAGIFVRAWTGGQPVSGGQWHVANSGTHPRWRADGKELFYQTTQRKFMSVSINAGPAGIEAGTPREFAATTALFSFGGWNYDVAADGQRILALEPVSGGQPAAGPIDIILNWQAMLR